MTNEIVKTSDDFLKGLTEKQRRGLIKLTHLENVPETQAELARALGITERGLYNWWKDPNWCQAIYGLIKKARIKHLPAIENALLREAKKGSFLHQRGFYHLIGEELIDSPKNIQTNVQILNPAQLEFLEENREYIKRLGDAIAHKMLSETESEEFEEGLIEGDFNDQEKTVE